MKKLLLLAGLAVSLNAAAQQHDGPHALRSRAAAMTRTMATKLQLNEGQYLKLKELNVRMLTAVQDINTRFAADAEVRDFRLADAQETYYRELAGLLNSQQLVAFQRSQPSMTALGLPDSN